MKQIIFYKLIIKKAANIMFAAAQANGKFADLYRELVELFESQNQSGDNTCTKIPATFLRVTVMV